MTAADPPSNQCKCGCGTAIPWKTVSGLPRSYVNNGHALRRHPSPRTTPPGYLTADEILALTPETIQTIADALLYGLARRTERQGNPRSPAWTQMVCDEVRRRPSMGHALHFVNMLTPPACATATPEGPCGKPGHYIVNTTTYCRAHAMTVGKARRHDYTRKEEARKKDGQAPFDDREAWRKRQDARRRFTTAVTKR